MFQNNWQNNSPGSASGSGAGAAAAGSAAAALALALAISEGFERWRTGQTTEWELQNNQTQKLNYRQ